MSTYDTFIDLLISGVSRSTAIMLAGLHHTDKFAAKLEKECERQEIEHADAALTLWGDIQMHRHAREYFLNSRQLRAV